MENILEVGKTSEGSGTGSLITFIFLKYKCIFLLTFLFIAILEFIFIVVKASLEDKEIGTMLLKLLEVC